MNPELKASIDNIHSLNISQEQKIALFGKLMEGVAAQYPPAPPKQPGLVNQPNIQPNMNQGHNVADLNAARQGGGPLSQNMNFISQVTGDPRRFSPPPQPTPQVSQVPTGLTNMNRRNDPLTNALTQTVMPTARQQHMPQQNSTGIRIHPNDVRFKQDVSKGVIESPDASHFPIEVVGPENEEPFSPYPSPDPVSAVSTLPGSVKPANEIVPDEKDVSGEDRGRFGMTGFFGDLFDDPRRMAMLSGGLTALDPNAYYDKEGFGSPWTGLRAGLGGAQAGYKSVIDRRKTEAEAAKLKAEAGAEGMGKDPNDWKLYQRALNSGFKGDFQAWLDRKWGRQAGTVSPMSGAMQKIYERQAGQVLDLQTEAEQAVIGLRNLYESKGFLDRPEGIISGPLAGIKTKFYSFLENRVGLDMGSAHANTEAFLGSMGSQVGQIIKQFGSGTGLSDADRDYAKMIVGGDIELDEDSIRELMRIQEKIYRHQISNYRSKSDPFSKGLKAYGYEGMDFSINTSGLDLKSKTDWGKRDKRRTRLGHYYYDANGKKVNTIQPRTNIKKALSRVEREELIELRKQKEGGWTFPNPFK